MMVGRGCRAATIKDVARELGLDWEAEAIEGFSGLNALKWVKAKGDEERQSPLPESQGVMVTNIRKLRAALGQQRVRESMFE